MVVLVVASSAVVLVVLVVFLAGVVEKNQQHHWIQIIVCLQNKANKLATSCRWPCRQAGWLAD